MHHFDLFFFFSLSLLSRWREIMRQVRVFNGHICRFPSFIRQASHQSSAARTKTNMEFYYGFHLKCVNEIFMRELDSWLWKTVHRIVFARSRCWKHALISFFCWWFVKLNVAFLFSERKTDIIKTPREVKYWRNVWVKVKVVDQKISRKTCWPGS